jgi:hypothetical protein
MNKKIVFRILIILIFSIQIKLYSQNSTGEDYYEFSAAASYNIPIAKLSNVYSPALGFHFGYNWVHDDYVDKNILKKGLTLGIMQFKPKSDTLFYSVAPNSTGTSIYTNYMLINATFHIEHIKTVNKFGLLAGGDVGLAITNYSFLRYDINTSLGEDYTSGKLIVSPLVGLNYEFNENFSGALIAQYNSLISISEVGYDEYNPILGFYKQYGSLCLRVGYSF